MDDVGNTCITLEKLITLDKWMNSSPRLCIQAVQREVGNGLAGSKCIPRPWETGGARSLLHAGKRPPPLHGGNKEGGCLCEGTGDWGSGFHCEWDGAGS